MKYLTPIEPSKAKGLVAKVYSQIKQDFGQIVEPFTLHSPLPELLAAVWMTSRESELVGIVPRETKEAIAASISQLNKCPYCVDAHTIMLRATGNKKTAQQITKQNYQKIQDPKIQKIIQWALDSLKPNSKIMLNPPFTKEETPEILGTAIFYHYINPMVTIFLGKTPLPIPFLRSPMKQIATQLFKKAVKRQKTPGSSLSLLPNQKIPEDLSWIKTSPTVAGAYARFANAIQNIEETYVPIKTKEKILQYMKQWNPKNPQSQSNTINKETIKMDPKIKTATTLALLTIDNPYRITKETINNLKKHYPNQNHLLAITSWASFKKATKIATWLCKN